MTSILSPRTAAYQRREHDARIVSPGTSQEPRDPSFYVDARRAQVKTSIALSERDRHALKWHLNGQTPKGRDEARYLDRVWEALKIDDVFSSAGHDPYTLSTGKVAYVLTRAERDALIWFMDKPKMGAMSRLLRDVDEQLLSGRDGE